MRRRTLPRHEACQVTACKQISKVLKHITQAWMSVVLLIRSSRPQVAQRDVHIGTAFWVMLAEHCRSFPASTDSRHRASNHVSSQGLKIHIRMQRHVVQDQNLWGTGHVQIAQPDQLKLLIAWEWLRTRRFGGSTAVELLAQCLYPTRRYMSTMTKDGESHWDRVMDQFSIGCGQCSHLHAQRKLAFLAAFSQQLGSC